MDKRDKIIELKGIDFNYGDLKALNNINLSVGRGVYGLLGPNGAGKTTLMKVILGFLKPQKGEGRILDFDIKTLTKKIRRIIGYMPEIDSIIPDMDAISITAYLGEITGMPKQEAIKRAHEVLFYVGLEDERYRLVNTYSTGMRQRLKLAIALVHDPDILFLDEPTSGMDPTSRMEMLRLIKDISKKGAKNIIFSSHILSDIEEVGENVIIMNRGEILSVESIAGVNSVKYESFEIKLSDISDKPLKIFSEFYPEKMEKGRILLKIPKDTPSYKIFKIAKSNGLYVREFKRSKTTLEEIFMKTIGESNAN